MKRFMTYFVILTSSLYLSACTQTTLNDTETVNINNQQIQTAESQTHFQNNGNIEELNSSEGIVESVEIKETDVILADINGAEEIEESHDAQIDFEKNSVEEEIVVNDLDCILYVKKNVNVRKGPSADYNKLGSLSKGDAIHITGITDNGWYRFEYLTDIAYVNSSFFIDEEAYKRLLEEELNIQLTVEEQKAVENTLTIGVEQIEEFADFKTQVVYLCNQKRIENGLPALEEDSMLDNLAQVRAVETKELFSHTRPDGSSCFTVLDGVQWSACGENIAAGQLSPEEVVNDWFNSEGHRNNILSPDFGKIGIGYVIGGDYGTYWVQIFTN